MTVTEPEPAEGSPVPAKRMADGSYKDKEQSEDHNDPSDQIHKSSHDRFRPTISITAVIASIRAGCRHGPGSSGAAQGHAIDICDGAGHVLRTGGHSSVIIARRKAVLHGLRNGAGLFFQRGIPEAVARCQIVVTVCVLLRLHDQKDQNTVVFAGTSQPPCIRGLNGILFCGQASGIIHRQHADLCTAALFGELGVEVFQRRGRAVAQDIGIVHDALVAGQVGQLGFRCCHRCRGQRSHADRQDQDHSTKPRRESFHRFHAKGSTSLTPNRPFSTLAGKPLVSF